MILTNINDNHFRLGYYRPNSILDFNYIIPSNIDNNDAGEIENIQDNFIILKKIIIFLENIMINSKFIQR